MYSANSPIKTGRKTNLINGGPTFHEIIFFLRKYSDKKESEQQVPQVINAFFGANYCHKVYMHFLFLWTTEIGKPRNREKEACQEILLRIDKLQFYLCQSFQAIFNNKVVEFYATQGIIDIILFLLWRKIFYLSFFCRLNLNYRTLQPCLIASISLWGSGIHWRICPYLGSEPSGTWQNCRYSANRGPFPHISKWPFFNKRLALSITTDICKEMAGRNVAFM